MNPQNLYIIPLSNKSVENQKTTKKQPAPKKLHSIFSKHLWLATTEQDFPISIIITRNARNGKQQEQ